MPREKHVSFLLERAGIGYPHTRKQVMVLVQEVMNEKELISVKTLHCGLLPPDNGAVIHSIIFL